MDRRLAAIMLTDIVSYSRLMELDEEGTIARQRVHRGEIIDPRIGSFGGRIVKSTGDGLLVEFPSVVAAVRCAVELQEAIAGHEEVFPDDHRIRYRIGINLGDIVIDGDDILGDGVNVAARLESLSEPGGICISDAVHGQLGGKLDAAFEPAGEQNVKNISRSIGVWKWRHGLSMTGREMRAQDPASISEQPTIAVLPFTNLSNDPEQEFFADGLADDIINTLSKISKMRVIARYSSFNYKGKSFDIRNVAQDLGARFVLEGGARRIGNRLRVTAQLIDARDGSQRWADRFDRTVEDIFDIQDEITKEVVTALQVRLTDGEDALAWARGTNSVEAWQLCVRAKELQEHLSATHLYDGRKLAKRAVEIDPGFAYAWAVLAMGFFREARLNLADDRDAALRQAAELAAKAMSLDDTVPWAIGVSAVVDCAQNNHENGLARIRQAIERIPGSADLRAHGAMVFAFSGEFKESIENAEVALSLNPYPPPWYRNGLIRSLALTGEFDSALRQAEKLLASEPDNVSALLFSVYCHSMLGRPDAARTAVRELQRFAPHFKVSHLADFLAMRQTEYVERIANALRQAGLPDGAVSSSGNRPSIAVLPFDNRSADLEHRYLADGVADDVITGLSRFKSLLVIARSSSFSFKGGQRSAREIAQELGVRYILEGSLQAAGNRVRVTAQLVDADSNTQIWADRFDDSLEDLFLVQDQITAAILNAIEPEISKAERDRARRTPPGSIDAWTQYQRALVSYFGTTEECLEEAAKQLAVLCEFDPYFAPAFAMAADTRSRLVVHYQSDRAGELLAEAEKMAARALELEPQDAVCYWADGRVKAMQGRYEEAIPQLERAIELNPNHAMAYHALGYSLSHCGRADEAIVQQDAAMRISPYDQFIGGFLAVKCEALLQLGRFDEVLACAQQGLSSPNPRYWIHASLAIANAELGRPDEARRAADELIRLKPDFREHVARLNQKGMLIYAELLEKHGLL